MVQPSGSNPADLNGGQHRHRKSTVRDLQRIFLHPTEQRWMPVWENIPLNEQQPTNTILINYCIPLNQLGA